MQKSGKNFVSGFYIILGVIMQNISIQPKVFAAQLNNTRTVNEKYSHVPAENSSGNIPAETYRAYALSNIPFKAENKINDISLVLTQENINPRICVEVVNNKKPDSKPGTSAIYEIALHDQMHDEIKKTPEIENKTSEVRDYKRKFDLVCKEDDLLETLKLIQTSIRNKNIEKSYIDTARQLAPVGYKLYSVKAKTIGNYTDVPEGTSVQNFKKMVETITYDDINKYNRDMLANSDTRITLAVNNDFYNKHKQEILPILNDICGD